MAIPISPLETALMQTFSNKELEALRARFLYAATSDHLQTASARATIQMAYETELRAPLTKMVSPTPGIAEELVATRRRFLDIDADMTPFVFLYAPALDAFEALAVLPSRYVRFLRGYVESPYPNYRMSALAAILCFAAANFGGL